jgi:hypothetical protein
MSGTKDFEDKKLNPRASYQHPEQVLNDQALTREQKIEILREWHYDAVRLQESAGENMTGGEPDLLRQVSNALLRLDVSPSVETDPNAPTKTAPWWRNVKDQVTKAFAPKPGPAGKPR